MKVGLFLENTKKGGLDTFVIQLIRFWPKNDQLVLFCNADHPGLQNIKDEISNHADIKLYNLLGKRKKTLSSPWVVWPYLIKIFIFIFGFLYYSRYLNNMLRESKIEKLLVINGGYPGGISCLSAIVVWGRSNKHNKAWMNFHSLIPENRLSPISPRRIRLFIINRKVAKYSKGFVSVSLRCINTVKNFPELHDVQQRYIYNGVRLKPFEGDLFSLKEKLFLDEQSRILLMLAVYELGKGYEFMFKVMSLLFKEKPDIHLVVCGDGSDEEFDHINNMRLNSSCPDNIHLMKFQKNIQSMLLESELLVMPSQEYESFGYAAVEAMLCKRAVIVTDVGGLPEVVKDGETGYVVNKDDYRLFLKSIIDLLDNDQKKADFSENGFLRAKSIFSPDRMSREYCKLVHDLDSLDFIKK